MDGHGRSKSAMLRPRAKTFSVFNSEQLFELFCVFGSLRSSARDCHGEATAVDIVAINVQYFETAQIGHPLELRAIVKLQALMRNRLESTSADPYPKIAHGDMPHAIL